MANDYCVIGGAILAVVLLFVGLYFLIDYSRNYEEKPYMEFCNGLGMELYSEGGWVNFCYDEDKSTIYKIIEINGEYELVQEAVWC